MRWNKQGVGWLVACMGLWGCAPRSQPDCYPLSPCHKERAKPPEPICQPPPDLADYKEVPLAILIDIGLCNNPSTKKVWAEAKQAVAQVGIANSALYPTLAFDLSANRLRSTGPYFDSGPYAITYYAGELSASYMLLDFGGGRSASIEVAKAALASANWNYSWEIQTVMVNIYQAYYQLVTAQELLKARQADLYDAEINLEAAQAQLAAGLTTTVDVLQTEAQFFNAKLQLVQQQVSLNTAQATLANAIGIRPTTQFCALKPSLENLEQVKIDADCLIEEAKQCRADLRALRAMVRSQCAFIRQQQSAFYPTLNFTSTFGSTYYKHFGSDNIDFDASLILSLPIFDGFLDQSNWLAAIAEYEEAIANLRIQENQAYLNVLSNYYSLQGAIESVVYSREYERYAAEAYQATLVEYRVGLQDLADLVQAQATLSDARAALIQSEMNYFIAVANLAYSRGALVHA